MDIVNIMEGRIRCRCGKEIEIRSDGAAKGYGIIAEGGKMEKAEGGIRIICRGCGKEAGKIKVSLLEKGK